MTEETTIEHEDDLDAIVIAWIEVLDAIHGDTLHARAAFRLALRLGDWPVRGAAC